MNVSFAIKNAAEKIITYLTLSDKNITCADIIFIAGGATIAPAQKAAELFKKKFSDKLVFIALSGTFSNQEWIHKGGDSAMYHDALVQLHIPESAMIWKPLATNTIAEAKLTLPFLAQQSIFPQKIILVDRPIHQRRAYATWKKVYPGLQIFNIPADETYEITKELLERLVGEIDRLQKYAAQGDLIRQEIPEEVMRAYEEIKVALTTC